MKCPFCEAPDTKVIDSRPTEEGHAIRRRRECEKCGKLVHLETDDLKDVCSQLKQEHGFSLDSAKTVLYGVCSECAETKGQAQNREAKA